MQREILTSGQGVEQPYADPCFGHVTDNADKFTLRRHQFGGPDQQGKTRRGAQFRTRLVCNRL